MTFDHRLLALTAAGLAAAGCAHSAKGDDGGDDGGTTCTGVCDSDGDGVPDGMDHCADTPAGAPVNHVGCADTQLTAMPELTFPPYGLTWNATGDAGRPGGLTWTYTGINRGELFHIYWIVCDDPNPPCAVSMDGPIDAPSETFVFSATDSDLPGGRLVFTNTTQIMLADAPAMGLTGRLTLVLTDANDAAMPFAGVTQLGVRPRRGLYGAEIPGTGFNVKMFIDVKDSTSATWTPYLDYFDGQHTVDMGPQPTVSVGATFYDK